MLTHNTFLVIHRSLLKLLSPTQPPQPPFFAQPPHLSPLQVGLGLVLFSESPDRPVYVDEV